MAKETSIELRSKLIYQVFVRNHSESGDFAGLIADLPRIKSLGVDFIYLMPINPISQKNRKGTLGSSYAIADYYGINPEYGKLSDFKRLIMETHRLDMQLWLDIVFNHSGCDNKWVDQHPEYYYKNAAGQFGNKIGEWWDVHDFDFANQGLWKELIHVLCYWAKFGVDGYRCDVASLIPLDFWRQAKTAVKRINPRFIWFAESIHWKFVKEARLAGLRAHSDAELYEVFDIEYNYDAFAEFQGYFSGLNSLQEFKKAIDRMDCIYPANFIKAHCLENHDVDRIHQLTGKNKAKTLNWLAFSFFTKGIAFVYGGQEAYASEFCNQFEANKISRAFAPEYCELIRRLRAIKDLPQIYENNRFSIDLRDDEVLLLKYFYADEVAVGLFNVGLCSGYYDVPVADGEYQNLLNSTKITVKDGTILLGSEPLIFIAKNK